MLLRYESPARIYSFSAQGAFFHHKDEGITITESFKKDGKYAFLGGEFGEYRVILKAKCDSEKELMEACEKARKITGEIDLAWQYVCGHPLIRQGNAFLSHRIIPYDGHIEGWRTNYGSLRKRLYAGKARVDFRFKYFNHAMLTEYPLQRVLEVRARMKGLDSTIKTLVELHYYALKVPNNLSSIFFMSKALELLRTLLPGRDDRQKEGNLPFGIAGELPLKLHSLYELSNRRYETRHITKAGRSAKLLPHMTDKEFRAFQQTCDNIIRAIVFSEMSLPLIRVGRA